MTNIKIAMQKLSFLDEITDDFTRRKNSITESIKRTKESIHAEVAQDYPDLPLGSDEYAEAYSQNWRYSQLEVYDAQLQAIDTLLRDFEKLAGLK